MTVRTAAGARFFIGPANETADELADYPGLAYTEVGEVEDLGEFGDHLVVDRVEDLGPVQRDARGVLADLELDRLVCGHLAYASVLLGISSSVGVNPKILANRSR